MLNLYNFPRRCRYNEFYSYSHLKKISLAIIAIYTFKLNLSSRGVERLYRDEEYAGEFLSVHARAVGIEGTTIFNISTDSNVNRYGIRLKCASRVRLKRASVVKVLNSSIAAPSYSRFLPFSHFNEYVTCYAYT